MMVTLTGAPIKHNLPQRYRGHGEKNIFSLIGRPQYDLPDLRGRRRSGKNGHPEVIVVLSNRPLNDWIKIKQLCELCVVIK